jgi:hypothetical protein
MARIPVERKQGIPGWLWPLLGLVVLVLVGLFLWSLSQDRQVAGPATTGAGAPAAKRAPTAAAPPAPAAGAPIADVPIGQPDKLAALAGKSVQLTNAKVQDVVGDKTFWVGPSDTQRLFVFLEEDGTARQNVEGKVDVNQGQTVTIDGEIRKLPSAEEARSTGA